MVAYICLVLGLKRRYHLCPLWLTENILRKMFYPYIIVQARIVLSHIAFSAGQLGQIFLCKFICYPCLFSPFVLGERTSRSPPVSLESSSPPNTNT